MRGVIEAAHAAASLGIATTLVGYPAATMLRARIAPRRARPGAFVAPISVLLAVRDEAARVRAKIDALLALEGAESIVELLVVSDGSTDGTDDLVRAHPDARVQLVACERRGKSAAIAQGIRRARGEIVVLCDARQRIEGGALRALLAPFADPEVGVVSGSLAMPSARGPGLYWRYEHAIRCAESVTGSLVGATGAFYAVRRALAVPPPEGALLDDVLVPLEAARRGARIVLAEDARVIDDEARLSGELARKARTIAGTWQLLRVAPWLLSARENPLHARFVLHKLARLVLPVWLAIVLVGDVALALAGDRGRAVSAAVQLVAWTVAALSAAGMPLGRVGRAAAAFAALQVAAVVGAARFVRGDLRWTGAVERPGGGTAP